jgi:putative FmdB family regulatory protein
MPIYEYFCPKCKAKFELLRPLSRASEPASCPSCKQTAERVLSTFACFSTSESRVPMPIGGNSCASCGSSNCSSCGI